MAIFDRTALLRFYDDKSDAGFTHRLRGANVSAITGVIGEELLLRLFVDCRMRQTGVRGVVLGEKPRRPADKDSEGRSGGANWLDAWVSFGPDLLAQVEIKNWSVHSLQGGKNLLPNAQDAHVQEAAQARWKAYFGEDHGKIPSGAKKVLYDYPRPATHAEGTRVERVLCFWQPIAPAELHPVTRAVICGKEVTVFSGSIYLRQLKEDTLELDCPVIDERIRILDVLRRPSPPPPMLRAVA